MIVLQQAADRTFVPKGCWMDRRPGDVVAGDFDGDTRTEAIMVAAPY